jgi:hypothetical protein
VLSNKEQNVQIDTTFALCRIKWKNSNKKGQAAQTYERQTNIGNRRVKREDKGE